MWKSVGIRCAVALLGLAMAFPAAALDPTREITQAGLTSWQADDGLPQNAVSAIAQTPDGYLWFGTQEGLARFDGASFKIFDTRSIGRVFRPHVTALLVAKDGSLWIGLTAGLAHYVHGRFDVYSLDDGLTDPFIWSLAEDPEGRIWIGTYSGGLYRWHNGRITKQLRGSGLSSVGVWNVCAARDGSLWLGTNGQGVWHVRNGAVTRLTTREGLTNDIVWAIEEDHGGDIWIGTNSGIDHLHDGVLTSVPHGIPPNTAVKAILEDRESALWFGTETAGLFRSVNGQVSRFSVEEGLSSTSVASLFEDREGSLWIGTSGGGVDQLRPTKFTAIGSREGMAADMIWSVREAPDHSMWVGTNNGVSHIAGGTVTNITTSDGLPSNVVRSILPSRDGSVWIGTDHGLARYRHGKVKIYRKQDGLSHEIIRALNEDSHGNIWIGTRGGGLNRFANGRFTAFTTRDGLPNDVVQSIDEDREGALWIATNGGVSRLKDGVFKHYWMTDGLSASRIPMRMTYQDSDGVYWIGTYGGGIIRLGNGRMSRITKAQGLFDDVAFSITEDGKGYLWMSCNRGVYRVRKRELNDVASGRVSRVHSIAYDSADGMRKAECNGGSPAAWKRSDGAIWFPTIGGVSIIDPGHLGMNRVVPHVVIEEILRDGIPASPGKDQGYVVGPRRQTVQIRYTATSFIAPKKIEFRYRLRGFDERWVDAGNRREAFYTNLPAGNYTFEVEARNEDGVWGGSNPVSIRIRPPFYRTWWFFLASALLVSGIITGVFRFRLKLMRAEALVRTAELERSLAQAQKMDSLGQMASGIAHDFNNTMMAALPWAELMGRAHPDDPLVTKAAANIRSAVFRARDVTRPLLDFAQPKQPVIQPLDLPTFLSHQLAILRPSLPPEIEIEIRRNGDRLVVNADPSQLSQVVINVALNARDAMPNGGCLRFDLRLPSSSEASQWGVNPSETVLLSVTDNGTGMSPETRQRVFDPFFTTKDIGKGAGLGLAVVHRIIQQHRGSILVQSELGAGTTLTILLPRAVSAPADVPQESPVADSRRLGDIRVLLIDDEEIICDGVKVLLELEGAEVRVAHRGATAMDIVRSGFEPHLIVLDLGLPEVPGEKVYEEIRRQLPNVPVIIASGYGERGRAESLRRGPLTLFRQKPYEVDGLIADFVSITESGSVLPNVN